MTQAGAGGAARTGPELRPLLEDGSLVVSSDPRLLEVVGPWLPRLSAHPVRHPAPAVIGVEPRPAAWALPPGEPAMQLYDVRAWLLAGEERVVLADPRGRVGARVELAGARAEVRIDTGGGGPAARDVFAALTISAALLLTRLRRALVHAAAVVAPGGGAWLLPGGSFNGKTTTCSTLIRGGWDYLCDDHVVLGTAPAGALHAEGWPRPFHLDLGYEAGVPEGVRARVDPDSFAPGRWRRTAALAGLLFPRVDADLPTALAPLHPAAALGRLLRESPWLLADPAGAAPVLALLERAARLPAYELRLGRDCYCNADRLQAVLAPALHHGGGRDPRGASPQNRPERLTLPGDFR